MKTLLKIVILFLLTISIYKNANAQKPITWQRTYGDNNIDYGYSIVQTPDEGYIAVGRKRILTSNYIYAMRLNKYGDTIWTRTFQGYQANQIEKTSDSNYIIVGNNLIKLNIQGDTIWTSQQGSGAKLKETSDKGFIVCLSENNGPFLFYPKLKKLDSFGRIQWERTYSENIYDGRFSDIAIDSEGNYLLTGNYSDTAYIWDYLFIMKTDYLGNVIWFKKYESYYYSSSIIVKDNEYYIGGSMGIAFLTKYNSYGNRIWLKLYDRIGLERSESYGLISTENRGKAFTGTYHNGDFVNYIRLVKTDSEGNELWRKLYGFGNADFGYGINQTSDSGYVIIGIRNNYNLGDVYIIKTDKAGFSSPPLSVVNNSINSSKDFIIYQNFPNPFNPFTNIKFKINKSSLVTINLFNVQGKKLKNIISEIKPAGEFQIIFNGTNLQSGIYFYQLLVNEKVIDSKKMVILK